VEQASLIGELKTRLLNTEITTSEKVQTKAEELETARKEREELLQRFASDLEAAKRERDAQEARLLAEIDVARKAVSALETEILKLMERIEKLEAQVAAAEPEMESRRVEIDGQLKKWIAAAETNRQRLEALRAERGAKMQALGPEARATYLRLSRMRSGFALAEARDYSCMACRMKIRPQVFADIRRGEAIFTCESCGRILYFKNEPAIT
jgi:hypothetical protein